MNNIIVNGIELANKNYVKPYYEYRVVCDAKKTYSDGETRFFVGVPPTDYRGACYVTRHTLEAIEHELQIVERLAKEWEVDHEKYRRFSPNDFISVEQSNFRIIRRELGLWEEVSK